MSSFRTLAARSVRWRPVSGGGLEHLTVRSVNYRCLQPRRLFRYQALDRSSVADLSVDEDGLVIDYPTLFERVES